MTSSPAIQINGSTKASNSNATLLEKLKKTYEEAGQSHVFTFFDKLSSEEQDNLLAQLNDIDVHRVNRIYANAIAADPSSTLSNPNENEGHEATLSAPGGHGQQEGLGGNLLGRSRTPSTKLPEEILPLPEEACATIVNNPKDEKKWREIGLKAISENKVAVLLMAGGQGTRLGSSKPKGMYDINLPSKKTLFEYQAERIGKLEKLSEQTENKSKGTVNIKWYVMTSGPTRKETENYFKEMNFFGLNPDNVIFFEQGVLPALSDDGKLLLSTPSSLSVAPDGNGGLYAALRRPISSDSDRTVLSDLKDNGIEYIHAYCVDNCLVKVADPVFIGCCLERNSEIGAKVVRKSIPTESVGVLALKGDRFTVVEYSELSKEKSEQLNPSNKDELAFKAANIANHFYTRNFLESVESMEKKMAYHIAKKKIQTINLENGDLIKPEKPNGMKLELFVFDVFPFTKSLCVLEVPREDEFSPLKNAPGSKADSPETSRKDLLSQSKKWLLNSGATFDNDDIEIEVTPKLSYSGENLDFVKGKKFIKSGVLSAEEDLKALTE
ncbi:uncharacterized protein L201_005921 [Kwoniella dendrophila CBS 6074]|uniref:UDP-N-acetylglucosamine diphosphorylase n=1 Tax=Kwoniella dendrophila CBS 6074 TaxID=1295534 RepID=A0AAX4K0B5_9TREE